MRTQNSREDGAWGKGRCTALTGVLCAIVLVPAFLSSVVVGTVALVALILAYYGLLRLFGDGFVIEGALIVLILAGMTTVIAPALMQAHEEPPPQQSDIEQIDGEGPGLAGDDSDTSEESR